MSKRRYLLVSLIACSLLTVGLSAQTHVPSARYSPLQSEAAGPNDPLVQPGIFDYDAQMFAPLDLSNISDRKAPSGFFALYDRVYMSIGRPNPIGAGAPTQHPRGTDYHWGNRYHAGFVTEEGKGIQMEYMSVSGSFFSAGIDASVPDPFITTTSLDVFELNRIFRERLSNGGFLEPYFGIRYTSVSDETIEDTTFFIGATEIPNRFIQRATNSAIGGQIGARYSMNRGRWTVRTDASLNASYNTQRYVASDIQIIPGQTFPSIFESTDEDSSFLPALDLQIDFAYRISRDFSIRTSMQIMYMWEGVNRANTTSTALNPNSVLGAGFAGQLGAQGQSFTSAGFGFGVEWRR